MNDLYIRQRDIGSYADPGFEVTYTDIQSGLVINNILFDGTISGTNIGDLNNGILLSDGSTIYIEVYKDGILQPTDPNMKDSSNWGVDISSVNNYTILYKFTNDYGKQTVKSRNVIITENQAPISTLNGNHIVYIQTGDVYTEKSISILDDNYPINYANIIVTGTVNTSIAGSYVLSYNYTDQDGRLSNTVTRTVVVFNNIGPLISLVGGDVTIGIGSEYKEPGYSAVDSLPVQTNITKNVKVTNNIKNNIAGTYTVKYKVVDQFGKGDIKTRTVIVSSYVDYDDFIITKEMPGSLSSIDNVLNVTEDRATKRALYNKDLSMTNNTEISDIDSLLQNMWNILFTEKNERLFNPIFGSRISFKLFDLMTEGIEDEVLDIIEDDIKKYEPRITVLRGSNQSQVIIDAPGNSFTVILKIQGQGRTIRTVSFKRVQEL